MRNGEVLLVGVGNEYRSDDAAGLLVARGVAKKKISGVTAIEGIGDLTSLLDGFGGVKAVYLVDAACSGDPPGTLHRFDLREGSVPAGTFGASTHLFGVPELIGLLRAMHSLPEEFIVYGVEGKSFDAGNRISPEVERAVRILVDRLATEIGER